MVQLQHWHAVALSAVGVFVGMVLLFVACAIEAIWWPLLTLIFFSILPISPLMCGGSTDFAINPGENVMQNLGNFLVGICVVSTIAVHMVLFHLNLIDGLAFFLAEASNAVFFGTAIGYVIWSKRNPSN